jgi:RHS repeat-associated protein
MTYTYNLGGALIEQQYPSGRVVKNVLDNSGDLSIVQSKKNFNSGYWNYANNFTYNAAGTVTSMQLGNGRWESTVFNSRLQPTQIALGTVQGGTDKLDLDFTYNTSGNADNNGNILSQTISVPGMTYPLIQTYTYDPLNRIGTAVETSNSSPTWKQKFSYDRYGNRRFDFTNGDTTVPASNCTEAICNPTISTSNNRLTSSGYSFDAAGNTTADAQSRTFVYDAENKQTSVSDTGGTIGQYFYDGDGKRIKKIAVDEVTIFVYDAAGKQIAEYSTVVASANDAKVNYLTANHLGSPRVNTDETGSVTARHDYTGLGVDIVEAYGSIGGRSATHGYGTDDRVRQQYTGYQHDDESGLEYAQARNYNSAHGRFTSVDPLMASANVKNPQTLNRYSYVLNSPYKFVDPLGLISESTGADGGCNFTCRVTRSIRGTSSLTDSDRDLAMFHIRNGTALGYVFLSLSESAIRRQLSTPTPPQSNVNFIYYRVSGANPDEAMKNAEASGGPDGVCGIGFSGCVKTIWKSLVTAKTKVTKVKGGYLVAADNAKAVASVTMTVYLPDWDGYVVGSRSAAEWDRSVTSLKDHEDGHVEISNEEAARTTSDMIAALPASRTVFSKADDERTIRSVLANHFGAVTRAYEAGRARAIKRNENYGSPDVTDHGRIPRVGLKY